MTLCFAASAGGRSGHIGPDPQPRQRRVPHKVARHAGAALLLAACAAASAPTRAQTDTPTSAQPMDCAQASQAPHAPVLKVRVLGAHSDKGEVIASLWGGDRSRFLTHHGWIARGEVPISGGVAEACFALSGPGTYAVSLYHDENGNHHFDRTLVGMPAEGFGVSNDAPTPAGLPSFDTTKFSVPAAGAVMRIHLRY